MSQISLSRNILLGYASQIYVTVIALVTVPWFLKYLGREAYGLIGFHSMLQMWFQLLDVGLTPTISRETARFRGGAIDAISLQTLLRALEGIFVCIAVVGALSIFAGAGILASRWLQPGSLSVEEAHHSIQLMGIIVALRWICGLYRGVISGFERLAWLGGINILLATARFVLPVPFLILVSARPSSFFAFQLGVAIVEVLILAVPAYRLLPKVESVRLAFLHWQPVRTVLRFSTGIALTSSIWIVVTQTDKLLLSKFLPLAEYSQFSIAVLLANGILVATAPIGAALLPRLTKLSAEGNDAGFLRLYRDGTQLVGVLAIPTAVVLALFAAPVLSAWTGDLELARRAAPVLTLYALGNGILAVATLPYYLQFAKGSLKWHVIGSVIFILILLPGIVWGVSRYGPSGAGYAWLAMNAAFLVLWIPFVHHRILGSVQVRWFVDLLVISAVTVSTLALARRLPLWDLGRAQQIGGIVLVSLGALVVAAFAAPAVRCRVFKSPNALQ